MKITYQLHLPMLVDHVEKDRNQKMHEMVNVEMHVPVIKFRQILYIFSWIKFIYNYTTMKFCKKKQLLTFHTFPDRLIDWNHENLWQMDSNQSLILLSTNKYDYLQSTRINKSLTNWFWYAVTAVKTVSEKIYVRNCSFSRLLIINWLLWCVSWSKRSLIKCIRGWYLCIELRTI